MPNTNDSTPTGKKPLKPPRDSNKDEALASLERQLQDAQDRHREERFIWISVVTILLTILLLHDSPSATLPLVVVLLELPLLIWVAKRCGVEDVAQLLDRLMNDMGRTASKGGE